MRTVSTMVLAGWIASLLWAAEPRVPPSHTANGAAPAKSAAKRPAPAMSDAQLEAAIRAKLAKSKLAPEKIQVHAQGGVVTLEGRTDVIQHKGTATRMAKTAGAVAVNNHIQVSDAAKQKSAANLAQGRRRVQVKRGDARSDARPEAAPAQKPAR